MLRRLLSLALCVFPAIAIDCDKCTGRDCFEICYLRQKILTTEARYKCGDEGSESPGHPNPSLPNQGLQAKYDALKVEYDALKTDCTTGDGVDTPVDECFTDALLKLIGCDGSAAGVDQCFMDGGGCASCCGACTITTDLDNQAKDSCVCYKASTAPSDVFRGTDNNDCVFIEAVVVKNIFVINQCLEVSGRRGRSARPTAERKSMLGTR